MAFIKGQSGNQDGRPPGAPNKVSLKVRGMLMGFLEDKFDEMVKDYEGLSPKDRVKVYTDLLQYGLPRLQAVSTEIEFEKLTDEQLEELVTRLKRSALPEHNHN